MRRPLEGIRIVEGATVIKVEQPTGDPLRGLRIADTFCEAGGRPDLIKDPRFETDALRTKNIVACIGELDEIFRGRSLAQWREILIWERIGELKEAGIVN